MSSPSTTEDFIKKANLVHEGKYCYDNTVYTNSKQKISILCKIHGQFAQMPTSHLSGQGCPSCRYLSSAQSNSSNLEEFVSKAEKIHKGYYDYSKSLYTNSKVKIVIVCPKHGEFSQTPRDHLRGQGCPVCGKIKKYQKLTSNTDEFVSKATKIHGDKYDYSSAVYSRSNIQLEIKCKIHGSFHQTPNAHLVGNGCPICGKINSGWKKDRYIEFVKKNKQGSLYLLRCYSDDEDFFKIGVTSTSLERRFASGKIPYKFDILMSKRVDDGGSLFDLEKSLLKMLHQYKYIPKIHFSGFTECFRFSDIESIISTVNSFIEQSEVQ